MSGGPTSEILDRIFSGETVRCAPRGITVRLRRDHHGEFSVECAPIGDDDFGPFESGPGEPTSVYADERHARRFITAVFNRELGEVYP